MIIKIDGVITMKLKRLIWHESLTAYYEECPYCHAQNSVSETWAIIGVSKECKCCHNLIDVTECDVRQSKEVKECEKLGLHGPVHRNDKGQWEEWVDPYEIKKN